MRKSIIDSTPRQTPLKDHRWLNIENIAQIELTSESSTHPIEGALESGARSGWRAESPGEQTIRFIFDEPQQLRRVLLRFVEPEVRRTQEFALRWSADGGRSFKEIVRQQWNFSPPGTTEEVEDYRVELAGVTVLELTITPDISGGDARASIHQIRLA